MSTFKLIFAGILVVIVAAGLAGLTGWHIITDFSASPADPHAESQVVQVPTGAGFNSVTNMLANRNIISSPFKFKALFYFRNRHSHIKAGEYRLSAAMPPTEIMNILIRGDVILHKITIPEGYNINQMALLVDKSGLVNEEAFLRAATNPDFVATLGIEAATAEGYLFPETYFFPSTVTAEKIVSAMIKRFKAVFTAEWKERAKEMGFSVHQIVTLASIIEKETGTPQERPLIASVFHNRLKRGMRLESDPTVIYDIPDFDGNLTRKHLNTLTPYNTYRIKGLPPGPIASPGKASLEAALYPTDTAFLYFVASGNGGHHFSTNFTDHNRAVRKFQLHR